MLPLEKIRTMAEPSKHHPEAGFSAWESMFRVIPLGLALLYGYLLGTLRHWSSKNMGKQKPEAIRSYNWLSTKLWSVFNIALKKSWKKVERIIKTGKLFKLRTKETFNKKFYWITIWLLPIDMDVLWKKN